MPKISSPTVKQHREKMMNKLLDAAEEILRTQGVEGLTASAVTAQVGIARNSLYRYVDSIDDLRVLVLARYLPTWAESIDEAVNAADTVEEKICAYVAANLAQAGTHGHGWLMGVTQGLSRDLVAQVMGMHADFSAQLRGLCEQVDGALQPDYLAAFISAITQQGFELIDAGRNPESVSTQCLEATRRLLG